MDGDLDIQVRVLMFDDEPDVAEAAMRRLERHGFSVSIVHDPRVGIERLASAADSFDVVLLDVGMPIMNGLEVLERIKQLHHAPPVVMWSADSTALTATVAMRAGAFSYATKPIVSFDEFVATLRSAASFAELKRHALELERQVASTQGRARPLGESASMREMRARIAKLAQTDISVLVLGESGTGKELVARSIHELGPRATSPFVGVNCGAISESLIDSELFGHVRGAFTGAERARPGLFVEANGGTIFLDEIAELPLSAQTRLLRVLQEHEVRPVGGDTVRTVDVRVVAATHQSLLDAVESKRFRADLYYRLAVATIEAPPLRARISDVPLLAAHFLRKHAPTRAARLTPGALEALMRYAWPGNVRELENALLLALALTSGDTVDELALPPLVTSVARSGSKFEVGPSLPDDLAWARELPLAEAKKRATDDFERKYVTGALERTRGNLTEAARLSGLDRSNFRRVLTRLGIDVTPYRDE